jgi:hypothetical protein
MLIDPFSFSIGAAGTLLGVLNYWRTWEKDRVRVRVRAGISLTVGRHGSEKGLFVEAVNLSNFPVTITSVRFLVEGTDWVLHLMPPFLNGENLPKRLEPRDAISLYTSSEVLGDPRTMTIKDVVACTACGEQIKGGRKARNGISQIKAVSREMAGEL